MAQPIFHGQGTGMTRMSLSQPNNQNLGSPIEYHVPPSAANSTYPGIILPEVSLTEPASVQNNSYRSVQTMGTQVLSADFDGDDQHFNSGQSGIPFSSQWNFGTNIIDFDLEKDSYQDFFEKIKISPNSNFAFRTINGNNYAIGNGATRQVYQKLIKDIILDLMTVINPYFVDVNLEKIFWEDDKNIELFVKFIVLVIKNDCLLPYHLHPGILEIISGKQMDNSSLNFFMEKMEPDIYNKTKNLNQKQFDELDSSYNSIEDLYRGKVCGNITNKKMIVYQRIAKYVQLTKLINCHDIISIDLLLSGIYEITPESVLTVLIFNDILYRDYFHNFLNQLNEEELKELLLTFGNTLSLNDKYHININEGEYNSGINISVCTRHISINKKVFDYGFNELKKYLLGSGSIRDGQNFLGFNRQEDNDNFLRWEEFPRDDLRRLMRHDDLREYYQRMVEHVRQMERTELIDHGREIESIAQETYETVRNVNERGAPETNDTARWVSYTGLSLISSAQLTMDRYRTGVNFFFYPNYRRYGDFSTTVYNDTDSIFVSVRQTISHNTEIEIRRNSFSTFPLGSTGPISIPQKKRDLISLNARTQRDIAKSERKKNKTKFMKNNKLINYFPKNNYGYRKAYR